MLKFSFCAAHCAQNVPAESKLYLAAWNSCNGNHNFSSFTFVLPSLLCSLWFLNRQAQAEQDPFSDLFPRITPQETYFRTIPFQNVSAFGMREFSFASRIHRPFCVPGERLELVVLTCLRSCACPRGSSSMRNHATFCNYCGFFFTFQKTPDKTLQENYSQEWNQLQFPSANLTLEW